MDLCAYFPLWPKYPLRVVSKGRIGYLHEEVWEIYLSVLENFFIPPDWGGTPYELLTLPMSQLTLSNIKLTLILHDASKTWLPLSLYNIWSHVLPLHMLTSSEVWYPMNYSGRLLLRTRSWHLTPSKIWLLLRWYLVGPSPSPLVEPPAPPHNCDSM